MVYTMSNLSTDFLSCVDRSKLRIGRLGSTDNYGTTSADDSPNITEDHSDDHTAVTNTEVASTQVPLVGESLRRHSVEEPSNTAAAHSFARYQPSF